VKVIAWVGLIALLEGFIFRNRDKIEEGFSPSYNPGPPFSPRRKEGETQTPFMRT
jgi:hypothetical protein